MTNSISKLNEKNRIKSLKFENITKELLFDIEKSNYTFNEELFDFTPIINPSKVSLQEISIKGSPFLAAEFLSYYLITFSSLKKLNMSG